MEQDNDIGIDICECFCVRETALAVLVRAVSPEFGCKTFWVPKSVICPDSEVRGYDHGSMVQPKGLLIVKEWWAHKQGRHPHPHKRPKAKPKPVQGSLFNKD